MMNIKKILAENAERYADTNGYEVTRISSQTGNLIAEPNTDIDRLLAAVKKQRWYFFKNKPKVLLDRNTGLLWANLDIFPWNQTSFLSLSNATSFLSLSNATYSNSQVENVINAFNQDNYAGWRLPKFKEFKEMLKDKTFPFQKSKTGNKNTRYYLINGESSWYCEEGAVQLFEDIIIESNPEAAFILPTNDILVAGTDYAEKASSDNLHYTEKERFQATLDLFVKNELWPVFDDDEMTQLYKEIYFLKPKQAEQLMQTEQIPLYSAEFDYMELLEEYDMKAIDASVIKYYQAVQRWTDGLLAKLDNYEQQKESVIRDFNEISFKLSKRYEANKSLTEEENLLLDKRQKYFQKKFSLDINRERRKILSVKKQADDIEARMDDIDDGDDAIHELAVLEREQRAGFSLLAENTAKIFRNFLLKIEYYEQNRQYVSEAADIWERWTEDYRIFKTASKEAFRSSCEEDSIEEELWEAWYEDWRRLRFAIEQKIQPVIEHGLSDGFLANETDERNVAIQIICTLETYKNSVDKFYLEDRKGIYQKYAFQSGGELQDKLETENCLYHCVAEFQSALSEIIFSCNNKDDRIFILNWADGLADFQIDRIFAFVADNELQEIAATILNEFSELKMKTYDIYLEDAKAYSEEKAHREKQYNSLIYRMRKNLSEQKKNQQEVQ